MGRAGGSESVVSCSRCGNPILGGYARCPACGRRTDSREPSPGAILGGVFGLVGLVVLAIGFLLPAIAFATGYPGTASLLDLAGGIPAYLWLALVPVLSSGVTAMGLVLLFGHTTLPRPAVYVATLVSLVLVAASLLLVVGGFASLAGSASLEYCPPYGYPSCSVRAFSFREGIPIAAGGAAWSLAGFLIVLFSLFGVPSSRGASVAP